MSILVALVCILAVCELAQARHASSSHEWAVFKRQHGKSYIGPEDALRFVNFMKKKALVESHNANSTHSYKLGLNHMADWSQDEFDKLNGFKADLPLDRELSTKQESFLNAILNDPAPLPQEVDWRKVEGRVSEIKDQGRCGSCWAFAAAGVLEGQEVPLKVGQKELISLSEQELVDCSVLNYGCNGGAMSLAFDDIKAMGGVMSEKDYPYIGKTQSCGFKPNTTVMTDSGAIILPKNDEDAIKKVVARYGPVSVSIYSTMRLSMYKGGVYSDPICKFHKGANHALLIVGYGTHPEAGDYWILKNSWSVEWGEGGYFRMMRGSNMCNVGLMPTIAKS